MARKKDDIDYHADPLGLAPPTLTLPTQREASFVERVGGSLNGHEHTLPNGELKHRQALAETSRRDKSPKRGIPGIFNF